MLRRAAIASLIMLALGACTGSSAPGDTGIDIADASHDALPADLGPVCTADIQCSDGLFCNGAERCAPASPTANARGCIAGSAPCTPSQVCAEATQMCTAADCMHPDADGDGHSSTACGGDDCDDTDPNRYPGNTEVCAFSTATAMRVDPTHDEDCDPSTISDMATLDGDYDGDTYIDMACCNGTHCGTDCADTAPVAAVPASLGTFVQAMDIHPGLPEVCNGVDDNCNGMIDDGNPGGGGSCGLAGQNECPPGVNECTMGALTCVGAGTCCPHFANCDGFASDGCETDIGSDVTNCGACGNVCPATGGAPACTAGVCGFGLCMSGYGLCGAACVDLQNSIAHCGVCDTMCTSAPANGTPACHAAVCGFDCNTGYGHSSGACVVIGAPRPIAPMSTATVTSQTPILRWTLPANADGASIDVCHDRACTSIVATVASSGTSTMPSAPLAAGHYFWRMRGTLGGDVGTALSATWEFWVGARSAPANTWWGTTLDVNGDGFADIAGGAPLSGTGVDGEVLLNLGSATGVASAPAATLMASGSSDECGRYVASAGDVNGDGFGDLIVGCESGGALLYFGSAVGVPPSPSVVLAGTSAFYVAESVASAGDLNGDGYGDLAVSGYSYSPSPGNVVLVYYGASAGPATTPSTVLMGTTQFGAPSGQGWPIVAAGDVNQDGFSDLLVVDPAVGANGTLEVFDGSTSGVPAAHSSAVALPSTVPGTASSVSQAGDVNGDGYADFVVLTSDYSALVYLGGAGGIASAAATSLPTWGTVTAAGDVNGDGYDDAVADGPLAAYDAVIYEGSATGLSTTAARTLALDAQVDVAAAGDVNGDGFCDVVVGNSSANGGRGEVLVYLGSATGIGATPATTLSGPSDEYGASVASTAKPPTGRELASLRALACFPPPA